MKPAIFSSPGTECSPDAMLPVLGWPGRKGAGPEATLLAAELGWEASAAEDSAVPGMKVEGRAPPGAPKAGTPGRPAAPNCSARWGAPGGRGGLPIMGGGGSAACSSAASGAAAATSPAGAAPLSGSPPAADQVGCGMREGSCSAPGRGAGPPACAWI